jgi:hypothetical protein
MVEPEFRRLGAATLSPLVAEESMSICGRLSLRVRSANTGVVGQSIAAMPAAGRATPLEKPVPFETRLADPFGPLTWLPAEAGKCRLDGPDFSSISGTLGGASTTPKGVWCLAS